MKMIDNHTIEWYSHATTEELSLLNTIFENGYLFEDMLFEKGTSTYDLIKCERQLPNGEWIDDEYGRPDELEFFDYSFFNYSVEHLDGCLGYYNHAEQLLCVDTDSLNNKSTILHEMIHLHENVINELPMHYHDMLLWSLYSSIKRSIPDIEEIITNHAHILNEHQLYMDGGEHDILFLLKSFDLDIRMSYPLGTVFAYGRSELFSQYSYNK